MSTISLPPVPRWFTLRQVVRQLREAAPDGRAPFGIKTLRRAIASGELLASTVGKAWLVRPQDVDDWIASQRITPTSAAREARVAARVREQLRSEAGIASTARGT